MCSLKSHRKGDRARVIVDAIDENGEFINAANTTVTVLDPQLKSQQLQLAQTAPGRYEAELMTPAMGNYNLQISSSAAASPRFSRRAVLSLAIPMNCASRRRISSC